MSHKNACSVVNPWTHLLALAVTFLVLGPGQPFLGAQSLAAHGSITIGEKRSFYSESLEEAQEFLVSKPVHYPYTEERFPVLYLLDGDDHFLHATATVRFLAKTGRIPHMIVVGISAVDRNSEFLPPGEGEDTGNADEFLGFIRDELIPLIDADYRTREFRTLMGHSLGGLFGVYALLDDPRVFQGYIVISPSLWWNELAMVVRAEERLKRGARFDGTVFLTMGNEGRDGGIHGKQMAEGLDRLTKLLESTSPDGLSSKCTILDEESHQSVPYQGTYRGLEHVFAGWHLNDPLATYANDGLEALGRHYERLSQRMGYEISIPLTPLFTIANHLLDRGRGRDALEVYDAILEREETGTAHFGRAKALDLLKEQEMMIASLKRAVALNPANESAREMLKAQGEVTEDAPEVSWGSDVLAKFEGNYQSAVRRLRVRQQAGKLFLSAGGRYELVPLEKQRFHIPGLDVQVLFNESEDGEISGLTLWEWGVRKEAGKIQPMGKTSR